MEITVTKAQFTELKKLISIVKEALNQETASGEASSASNSVEWSPTEVKFTLT